MNIDKLIYWLSTGLLCTLMILSASMYLTDTENAQKMFDSLGYPAYIVIPFGIAKILGVIAILTKQSTLLKEWAYAGFFFDMVLAAYSHIQVSDGQEMPAILGLVFLLVSRIYDKRVFVYH